MEQKGMEGKYKRIKEYGDKVNWEARDDRIKGTEKEDLNLLMKREKRKGESKGNVKKRETKCVTATR